MAAYWDFYRVADLSPDDPRVAPLNGGDFAKLPPALIHVAEFDPLRDEGEPTPRPSSHKHEPHHRVPDLSPDDPRVAPLNSDDFARLPPASRSRRRVRSACATRARPTPRR